MDLEERSELMFSGIIDFLPNLLGAILILLVGLIIAKLLEKGTDALLEKLRFDQALDRGGVNRALARTGTKLDPSSLVARLVFWVVALVAILMASNALGLTAVSQMFYSLITYIPNVIVAVFIVIIGLMLGELVRDLIAASMGGVSGYSVVGKVAKAAIVILAVFMALDQLEVAPDIVRTAFTLLLGAAALAAGLAFGLGCRDLAGEYMRRWVEQGARKADEVRQAREAQMSTPGGGRRYDPEILGPPPVPAHTMASTRVEEEMGGLPPSPVQPPPRRRR